MSKKPILGKISIILITAIVTFLITAGGAVAIFLNFLPSQRLALAKEYILSFSLNTDITEKELEDASLRAMVAQLRDPYSMYLDEALYADMLASFTSGEYVGVGITTTIDYQADTVTVVTVTPSSPAEKAGIREGDRVVSLMDEAVNAENFNQLSAKVKSKKVGDEITVMVMREGESEPKTLNIVLDTIKNDVVTADIINSKYAYINIGSFEVGTADEFKEELDKALDEGVEGLIIDVRHNPGGLVDEVVPIIDRLMGEGTIATMRNNKDEVLEEYKSDKEKVDIPIIIFVDSASASASELLAGTLQDTGNATIIGTMTFGKAVGQTIFPLDGKTGLYFSHMKVFLPSGISINGVGVRPDYKVTLDEGVNVYTLDHKDDPYVDKAIEIFENR